MIASLFSWHILNTNKNFGGCNIRKMKITDRECFIDDYNSLEIIHLIKSYFSFREETFNFVCQTKCEPLLFIESLLLLLLLLLARLWVGVDHHGMIDSSRNLDLHLLVGLVSLQSLTLDHDHLLLLPLLPLPLPVLPPLSLWSSAGVDAHFGRG